jgi:Ca2+-dependent lipid-binding protein
LSFCHFSIFDQLSFKITLYAGLSDPYVIIRILPDNKAIKPRQSAKKSETLNPVFNETHELYVNYVHMLVAAGKRSYYKSHIIM